MLVFSVEPSECLITCSGQPFFPLASAPAIVYHLPLLPHPTLYFHLTMGFMLQPLGRTENLDSSLQYL